MGGSGAPGPSIGRSLLSTGCVCSAGKICNQESTRKNDPTKGTRLSENYMMCLPHGIVWIESESAINQHDHCNDVLTETGERVCGVGQHARGVLRYQSRFPSACSHRDLKCIAAQCRKAKGRAELWVAGDGILD